MYRLDTRSAEKVDGAAIAHWTPAGPPRMVISALAVGGHAKGRRRSAGPAWP